MSSLSPNAQQASREPDDDSHTGRPSREEIFEVLSNRRRRYVLHYLKQLDEGETAPLSEIATQVAAWERGEDVADIAYEERKSVQTSLYQTHLPKLAEKNLIEYDPDSNLVFRRAGSERIQVYLEMVSKNDLPWSYVFLGLSTTLCLLAIAAWLEVYPLGRFEPVALFLIGSVLFLGTSTWYAIQYHATFRIGGEGPPPDVIS